jgi:hypothetical protein
MSPISDWTLDRATVRSTGSCLTSYFQSRKLGFQLIYTAQLSSSVEKRLRNLTDVWILAENKWEEPAVGEEPVENFYYTVVTPDTVNYFSIMHEDAMRFFPLYKSTEVVREPVGSVKKSELKKMQQDRVSKILAHSNEGNVEKTNESQTPPQ